MGVPVVLQVMIADAQQHHPPTLPTIDGVDGRVTGPSHSSQMSFINGRMSQSTTDTYSCVFTPRKAGTITIGPVRVEADGTSTESPPVTIVVRESESGDLLFVEIQSERDSVYVGEPLEVTLEVWLKPYQQSGVTLDMQTMWDSCVDVRQSTWGPFAAVIENRQVRVRRDSRRDENGRATEYYVYFLKQTIWPEKSGTVDLSDVFVIVQYPTEVRRRRFSLLGPEYTVSAWRPVSAGVQDVAIGVKPPPREGQPDSFRGAVGQYALDVRAVPREVSVGDPITLTIELSGSGRLDLLQPPPLATELMTRDFKIPDETLSGVVEQGVKQFTQSIRAKRADVGAVPPVEFSYFDPRKESYVVLRSEPIPLMVRESSRMVVSQVMEGTTPDSLPTELTLLDTGMWANHDDLDALLARQTASPGMAVWAITGVMPAIYALFFFIGRNRDRLRSNVALARKRSARRSAFDLLDEPRSADDRAGVHSVATAITRYIADRFNLPAGGVTRGEAVASLREANVPASLVQEVDDLLAGCESMQYGGLTATATNQPVGQAKRCIDQMERIAF